MGLQEQIAEAIIIAFDELGGDPQRAVESALRQPSIEDWVKQETAKIAIAGGAEMIIPGIHGLTIPAGISYLIHKMASISWGIGAMKGAYIVETERYSDLRNILTLWANAGYYNTRLLTHEAISLDAFEAAVSSAGYHSLLGHLQQAEASTQRRNLVALADLAVEFRSDERSQRLYGSIAGKASLDDLMQHAITAARPIADEDRQALNRRISTRLAGRLAAQISARVPARLIVGFIPIAGAVVNAFFNVQTLRSMSDIAQRYYDHQIHVGAWLQDKA